MQMKVKLVKWLDDLKDPDHRPHHIYRCIIECGDRKDVHALGKENDHSESQIVEKLHTTPIGEHMPAFYGVIKTDHPKPFLMQEDMNYGFQYPCTIDFKLGTRQWDLTASEKFRVKLIEKCNVSTSHSIGVRLVTATVLDRRGRVIENTTKSQNLRLSEKKLREKVKKIIPSSVRKSAKSKMKKIRESYADLLKQLPNFRMFSASLLLCFDGADSSIEPRLSLIDFAHTHFDIAADGFDPALPINEDGVLFGMDTMVTLFAS